MDRQTKLVLARLLGENFRLQRRSGAGICPIGIEKIYALVAGIEPIIDEIFNIDPVTKDQLDHAVSVFDEVERDEAKLAAFKGFYDIEDKLASGGVDRPTAIVILRYLNAFGGYSSLIRKMNSSDSPSECREFRLDQFDV